MNHTYVIGGSPCSGKSTVAKAIADKFGCYYFKVDDFLDEYIAAGAASGKPVCAKLMSMTPEQIWMRDPNIQCLEEIQFYHETFDFVMQAINGIPNENGIIAEGAAFLPELMFHSDRKFQHYVSLTPTPEFQIHHYKQRPFIKDVLKGCSDEKTAFKNWMDRDLLFAEAVRKQSNELGFTTIVNDGTVTVEDLVNMVSLQFSLQT